MYLLYLLYFYAIILIQLAELSECKKEEQSRKSKRRINEYCNKGEGPENRTPTEHTVYNRIFTLIGDDGTGQPKRELWQPFWTEAYGASREEIIQIGRTFVNFVMEMYGIDASALTDHQLADGSQVDVGTDFIFAGHGLDIIYRVITETTTERVKYYRNTTSPFVLFALAAKNTVQSTGRYKGEIRTGNLVCLGFFVFQTNECGFTDEKQKIEFRTSLPLNPQDRLEALFLSLHSDNYGEGIAFGTAFSNYGGKNSTASFVMRFPANIDLSEILD